MDPLESMRREYTRSGLDEASAGDDPIALLSRWLDDRLSAGATDATAFTLSTVDPDGQPSARVVLLKGLDADGLRFFTNYDSRKGRALAHDPRACASFFWAELERQVRVDGPVERLDDAENDAYFASRPLEARYGAWASAQSEVIDGRAALEQQLAAVKARFAEPPRPPHWGGYLLRPRAVEFWQGRPSRLHDRIRFTWAGGWRRERLCP